MKKLDSRSRSTFLYALLTTVLLSCNTTTEPLPTQKQVLPLDPPAGANFVIDNQSGFSYSSVTINGEGQSMNVAINSIGTFYFTVPFTPSSIMLNSSVCPYPDTTIIQLATTKVVTEWSGASLIAILDYNGHD